MKRPNITPGPWVIILARKGLIAIEHGTAGICTMDHDEEDREFCERHARAIAALPQLLDAFEGLLGDSLVASEYARLIDIGQDSWDDEDGRFVGVFEAAEAAFLKAGYMEESP